MINLITSYFNQFKIYFIIGFTLLILFCIVFSYKFTYDKGFNSGKNETEITLNKEYQKALENKLKEQKEILEKNFNVLMESEKQKSKVKTIFVDREKKIKEIIKEENFKAEMTEEQIKKLNDLTRLIR